MHFKKAGEYYYIRIYEQYIIVLRVYLRERAES
jgi:hypothetical protein